MRLCSVKNLKEGMVLGKSIYESNNKLLLGAGYRITPQVKKKLQERNYTHVYIMEEGTDNVIPEDIISDEMRQQARTKLTGKIEEIEQAMQFQDMSRGKIHDFLEKGHLNKINLASDIRKIINEIISEIAGVGAAFLNTLMIKTEDSYFVDHAINTTVLAIIIAKRYRFTKKEMSSLALGTFLHDIGKVIIEQAVRNTSGITSEDLYKEHPTFGYILLKNDPNISPMENQVVNQHHENQDGSGFPIGLVGDNLPPTNTVNRETKGRIFRFSEICAVANAYDKLVLNPREEDNQPQDVIKKLLTDAGTIYNKHIVDTLCEVVALYPVGAYVKIVNIVDPTLVGCYGVVAKINEDDLSRPVIIITANKYHKKIKPIMLDTAKLKIIDLKLVI